MKDAFVFHGVAYRVQVKVFDWSDAPPNMSDGKGGLQKDRPTKFLVRVLSQRMHKSSSYSGGQVPYFGTDFERAWSVIQNTVGNQKLPKGLAKYRKVAS